MQDKSKDIRFLICPDKFRGSLNASEVSQSVQKGLNECSKQIVPHLKIIVQKLQLADGGQGSLDALHKNVPQLQIVQIIASDPLFRPIKTFYLLDSQRSIAYVEMAKVSGLSLLQSHEKNPMHTSTFGVGEIIRDILDKSVQKIYLFIGGSATNDAGIGMANALGFSFLDHQGQQLQPIGKNLIQIRKIIQPPHQVMQEIVKTDIFVLTDVQNVFFGQNGAAYVYGPQKGASKKEVEELDKGLFHINQIFQDQFKKDLQNEKGSGAAGGLGGGVMIFLRAKKERGIDKVMQIIQFYSKASQYDILITGEGKLDKQSLQGKVISGVIKEAKRLAKPLWIVCGTNELNIQSDLLPIYQHISVLPLVNNLTSENEAMIHSKQLIKDRIKQKMKSYFQLQKLM